MAKRFPVTSSSADGSSALAFTAIHIAITGSTVTGQLVAAEGPTAAPSGLRRRVAGQKI